MCLHMSIEFVHLTEVVCNIEFGMQSLLCQYQRLAV